MVTCDSCESERPDKGRCLVIYEHESGYDYPDGKAPEGIFCSYRCLSMWIEAEHGPIS